MKYAGPLCGMIALVVVCTMAFSADSSASDPRLLPIGFWAQASMVAGAYFVKPLYMLLTLLIVLMFKGRRSQDMVLIRTGLLLFLLGELACMFNYALTAGTSDVLEIAHDLGMVSMNALLPWGLLLLLDDRVFHYLDQDKTCVLQRLCGRCWKKEDVPCGPHSLAKFLLPALMVVSLIPWFVPLRPFAVVMPVFGTDVLWVRSTWNLLFELRLFPAIGAVCFAIAFVFVLRGKRGLQPSLPWLFMGVGFASFALFRTVLFSMFYENPAWDNWWEEATELLAVIAVLWGLTAFRTQLGLRSAFSFLGKRFQ